MIVVRRQYTTQRVGTDVSEQPDISTFSTEAVKAAGTFIPDYTASQLASKSTFFKAFFP